MTMHARLLAVALTGAALAAAQAPLGARYRVETTYPSMTQRHVVKLDVSDWSGIWAGHGAEPDPAAWPWTDPRRYYVQRVSDTERIPVQRVLAPGVFTGPSDISVVYLELDPEVRLRAGEQARVLLLRDGSASSLGAAPASDPFEIRPAQKYNINLAPTYAPNQELIDSRKRNVAQLNTVIDIHQLYSLGGRARGYFNMTNLVSTDGRDRMSQLAGKWGIFERSLSRSWFIPAHLETKLIGDQALRYASSVTSLGIRTLVPWRFTRKLFYNGLAQAPVSPVFSFDGQFERRMPRAEFMKRRFPELNQPRFAAEMSWTPIRLLPSPSSEVVSLEILARAWYLPWDRNLLNKRIERAEGYLQISLLVPMTRFDFTAFNFVTDAKEKAKQRIRVQYAAGANEALGFMHSSRLTVGVEIVK